MRVCKLMAGLAIALAASGTAAAGPCKLDQRASARTVAGMDTELATANSANRRSAYERYIALFDPGARVFGLVADRIGTIEDVRKHYRAVFFELQNGTLVEDDRIVVGEMGAHRYHSMLTLNGTFDGVVAKDKPVTLRGQTFFRYGSDGRIVERWSNHDHAYRMGQLLGDKGRDEGARIAAQLNGPGLSEEQGYTFVTRFTNSFSRVEAPAQRRTEVASMLADGLIVHGLNCGNAIKSDLLAHYDSLWTAFPDLHMQLVGEPMSGWSMVAFRWQARSSQRAPWRAQSPGYRTIATWRGQAIARLNGDSKITELWLNEEPVSFDR